MLPRPPQLLPGRPAAVLDLQADEGAARNLTAMRQVVAAQDGERLQPGGSSEPERLEHKTENRSRCTRIGSVAADSGVWEVQGGAASPGSEPPYRDSVWVAGRGG